MYDIALLISSLALTSWESNLQNMRAGHAFFMWLSSFRIDLVRSILQYRLGLQALRASGARKAGVLFFMAVTNVCASARAHARILMCMCLRVFVFVCV